MRITPKIYLHGFTFIVFALAIVRLVTGIDHKDAPSKDDKTPSDSIVLPERARFSAENNVVHRINSVPNYDVSFPDANDVQLESARKYGVSPVRNREDAERRKEDLVFVGSMPYVSVDNLRSSVPYLVPRAAVLLHDIGRAYYDSLQMKGVPLHRIIATSVLRTKDDVEKLRRHNSNATENSCHLYGTTFDIAQHRFVTVEDPDGPARRKVTDDTLKWVLSEVLRDMREQGRCYVKYEKRQGCFHISVR